MMPFVYEGDANDVIRKRQKVYTNGVCLLTFVKTGGVCEWYMYIDIRGR